MLASPTFSRADRSRQLLRYLVEQTLAGNGHQLKGYTIGIAVFERGDDFDPQEDNIVRVNGGRLRQKLDEYYQSEEGLKAEVVIELPDRSYLPRFFAKTPSQELPQEIITSPPMMSSTPPPEMADVPKATHRIERTGELGTQDVVKPNGFYISYGVAGTVLGVIVILLLLLLS